ncbi:MAG: hypothetical protein JW784_01825 [Candidatus Cloacimonetes bacterium]|nr:hypothetical protein [Candidatus Cloacimonadota bacterium]
MNLVVFDDNCWRNFLPLTFTRPVGDLRLGILKLRQRLSAYLDFETSGVLVIPELTALYRERHPQWLINQTANSETLFVNSRLIIDDGLVERIHQLPSGNSLWQGADLLAAVFTPQAGEFTYRQLSEKAGLLQREEAEQVQLWQNIWEMISRNAEYIEKDFQDFFYDKDNFFETEIGITVLNPYNIWLGEGVEIKPGVVIDASAGPVVVDEGTLILPNTVIIGPAYIGKNTILKAGARILAGTSIGPVCKIGGELESSIIQGYSNKQHDGYLGHSYLGEWVNIGAGTSNSDLKNNYRSVRSYYYPRGEIVDTGQQFLGTICGDHVKLGINTAINTGSVIGTGCNLFGGSLISGFIPSLHWGSGQQLEAYDVERFLAAVRIVKDRRGLELSVVESSLYQLLPEMEQKLFDAAGP